MILKKHLCFLVVFSLLRSCIFRRTISRPKIAGYHTISRQKHGMHTIVNVIFWVTLHVVDGRSPLTVRAKCCKFPKLYSSIYQFLTLNIYHLYMSPIPSEFFFVEKSFSTASVMSSRAGGTRVNCPSAVWLKFLNIIYIIYHLCMSPIPSEMFFLEKSFLNARGVFSREACRRHSRGNHKDCTHVYQIWIVWAQFHQYFRIFSTFKKKGKISNRRDALETRRLITIFLIARPHSFSLFEVNIQRLVSRRNVLSG